MPSGECGLKKLEPQIPFLPESWKWKMGPSNISFLSFKVVFHFHDYGRKSGFILLVGWLTLVGFLASGGGLSRLSRIIPLWHVMPPLLGWACSSKHHLCLVLKMMCFFTSTCLFQRDLLGLKLLPLPPSCASQKGQDYERECNERYNTGETNRANGVKKAMAGELCYNLIEVAKKNATGASRTIYKKSQWSTLIFDSPWFVSSMFGKFCSAGSKVNLFEVIFLYRFVFQVDRASQSRDRWGFSWFSVGGVRRVRRAKFGEV